MKLYSYHYTIPLVAMTVLDNKLITAGGAIKDVVILKEVVVLNAGQWRDYSEM